MKWLKSKSSNDRVQYKFSMELYSAIIKEVRTDYYKDALSMHFLDLRERFNVLTG